MQEIKYISCIYRAFFFFVPKEVRLSSIHYPIMKIYNIRELQQISSNHLAGIDYKDFVKVYKKCTNEPYSFLTTDTTLPTNSFLRLIRFIIKITLTDELKILDDKIKAIHAQYDLDREATKISTLSSKELDKYEYVTGKDLGCKPGKVEKDKFEYFPSVEALNDRTKSRTIK